MEKVEPSLTEAGISLLQFELEQHVSQTFWPNNHKVNTNITVQFDTFLLSFCSVCKRNHFKSYQTLACLVTWRLLQSSTFCCRHAWFANCCHVPRTVIILVQSENRSTSLKYVRFNLLSSFLKIRLESLKKLLID